MPTINKVEIQFNKINNITKVDNTKVIVEFEDSHPSDKLESFLYVEFTYNKSNGLYYADRYGYYSDKLTYDFISYWKFSTNQGWNTVNQLELSNMITEFTTKNGYAFHSILLYNNKRANQYSK